MSATTTSLPVLVAGGGIGGLAAALALVRRGFRVKVLEQAPEIGEIGAGIQLGPNAFHAFDALGVGDKARSRAVYTDHMVMHDAVDESLVGEIPTGEAFRQRFGNPYAVIHRVDVHLSLLEGAQETGRVEFRTSTRIVNASAQDADGVTVYDQNGNAYRGLALIGADGVKSVVRAAVRRRPAARHRPRGLPRGGRQEGLPGRPAVERRQHLGRPELPPGALPAARRRAVQRGRHLPQPPEGGMGRHRGQQGRGAELLPGHLPEGAPADRPAQDLEALGHRRPRADRPVDLRPRHAARRRRASDARSTWRRARAWRWKTR